MQQFLKDVRPLLYGRPVMYFDAGAYNGTVFAEVAEADWGDRVEAHLIEPNPESFRSLKQVAASAKHSKRVRQAHCHNLAVGSINGSLRFRSEGTRTRVLHEGEHFDTSNTEEYFEVNASTLDEIAAGWGVKHISILKIDVEGHEGEVLKGAQNLLESQAVDILYIEAGIDPDNRQQFFYRTLEDALRPLKYRLFRIYEQTHEWLTDSPFLRRVNLAFMSEAFATQTPYRLSKKLFELQRKNSQIESALAEATDRASKTAVEQSAKCTKLETDLFASEVDRAALREKVTQAAEATERQAIEFEAKLAEREKMLAEKDAQVGRYRQKFEAAEEASRKLVAEFETALAENEKSLVQKDAEIARYRQEIETAKEAREKQVADFESKLAECDRVLAEKDAETTRCQREIEAKFSENERALAERNAEIARCLQEIDAATETGARQAAEFESKLAELTARLSKSESEKNASAENLKTECDLLQKKVVEAEKRVKKLATELRISEEKAEQLDQGRKLAISEKKKEAANHEAQAKELQNRISALQDKLENESHILRAKVAASESSVLAAKETISFKLGGAILDALKSPASAFALPSTLVRLHKAAGSRVSHKALRQEISERGPRFHAMLELLRNSGLPALQQYFASINLSSAGQVDVLTVLAKEVVVAAPLRAIDAAREAQKLDPKPYRAKWLAFRLAEQGLVAESAELLASEAVGNSFSVSEQKRKEEILAKHKVSRGRVSSNGKAANGESRKQRADSFPANKRSKKGDRRLPSVAQAESAGIVNTAHARKSASVGPKKKESAQNSESRSGFSQQLRDRAERFIKCTNEGNHAALFQERQKALPRYFQDDEYFLTNFSLLLMCGKLSAHLEGAALAGRILQRFEGRIGDLRRGTGANVYQRFITEAALCFTRVGRYKEARALVDAAFEESGGQNGYAKLRAEICWPHDPAQAVADLRRVASDKQNTPNHLLLAHIASLEPGARGCGVKTGEFLLVDANLSLAGGNFREYAGLVNDYFSEQGLAGIFSPGSEKFGFADLSASPAAVASGPLVTVIMTTFNSAMALDYAVDSILKQTHQNLELFIVDDGSSDATIDKLNALAARDNRVRLIFNEANTGTYAAKNRAMEVAQGEFITFHDSDDWAHPERIAKHLEVMMEFPELQATRSDWLRVLPCGRMLFRRWGKKLQHANPASVFLRKTALEQIGYFDSVRFGADSEYWFRLQRVLGRGKFRSIKLCLGLGCVREESLTQGGAGAMDAENFSPVRSKYNFTSLLWHAAKETAELNVLARPSERPFPAPPEMISGVLPPNASMSSQFRPRFVETQQDAAIPYFVFGISLASATVCSDWSRTQELLGHTLRSLLGQTDGRLRVVICGHEAPDLPEMTDERILFFESDRKPPGDPTGFRKDKMHKRRLMGSIVREMGGGYVFPLDADDLVHAGLVEFCLGDNNRHGYVINKGYVQDYNNGRLAPVPGAWDASYDRVCGSSGAIYFRADELPCNGDDKNPNLYFNLFQSHAYWPIVAQEFGRPLGKVPFAAGVYSVNHSQNLSFGLQRAGSRSENIISSIERNAIPDGYDILQRDFNWGLRGELAKAE